MIPCSSSRSAAGVPLTPSDAGMSMASITSRLPSTSRIHNRLRSTLDPMHLQEPSGVRQSSGSGSVQGGYGPVISTNSPAMPSTLMAVGSVARKPGAPASASARSRTVGPTPSGRTPKPQGSPWAVSTIQKLRKAAPWSLPDWRTETVRPVVARPSQPFGTVTVIGTGKAEVVVYVPAVSGPFCGATGDDAGLDVEAQSRSAAGRRPIGRTSRA